MFNFFFLTVFNKLLLLLIGRICDLWLHLTHRIYSSFIPTLIYDSFRSEDDGYQTSTCVLFCEIAV